jgi:hypothetical protein
VDSFHDSGATAFASITHDDVYGLPVSGPVSVLVGLTCFNLGVGAFGFATGHFSLGSTSVSPSVESIWSGASQGSGPCGYVYQIAPIPAFLVSLFAVNNTVDLHTYIDGSGRVSDGFGGIDVSLTVNGFLDANGNPIEATLLPEPGTLGMFGVPLLMAVGIRRKRKLFVFVKSCLFVSAHPPKPGRNTFLNNPWLPWLLDYGRTKPRTAPLSTR